MTRRARRNNLIEIGQAVGGLVLAGLAFLGYIVFNISPDLAAVIICAVTVLILVIGGVIVFWLSSQLLRNRGDDAPGARGLTDPNGEPAALRPGSTDGLLERLRAVDWFQFEQIVAIVYRKAGFQVERRGGANPDGGIDIVITDSAGLATAIQCKQWKSWNVGVKSIREFVGAMKIASIQKGIFVTLRGYTDDARQTADANNIELVNESGLARLLESADARFDSEILGLLNDTKKICPKCEHELILRTATRGANPGSKFWGCSKYPRCRYTMPVG